MVMGIVGGLINGGLAAGANALGIGKNNTRAKTFAETQGQPGGYDPNAFHYGGTPTGADDAANRYEGLAAGAQGRTAPQAQITGANFGDANNDDAMGMASRANQGTVANMMMARAQGLVPSIAQQQASLQMQQAAAAQASAAASARGAGGLAMAQQNAANNTATMQSAISNQAQINAANERMQAEGAAFNAFSGMRGQDASAATDAASRAEFNATNANQGNEFNAGLTMNQRGMNDAMTNSMTSNEIAVRNAELNAGIQGQGMLSGNQQATTGMNVAISKSNADVEKGYFNQAVGGLQGGADASSASGLSGGGAGAGGPAAATASAASVPVGGMVGGYPSVGGGVPSDDRAKFGVSPLSMLRGRGSSGGGLLLSDDNAKRAVYALGRAHGMQQSQVSERVPYAVGSPLSDREELVMDPGGAPQIRPRDLSTRQEPVGSLDRDAQYGAQPAREIDDPNSLAAWQFAAAKMGANDGVRGWDNSDSSRMVAPEHFKPDAVTQQFAQGLAPIRFQYKPGLGPQGEQTGVRAQAAASQPVTASMIQQRPDGLLAIDPRMGLSTALAGVGHLAKKQQEQDMKLEGLLAMAARREGR